MYRIDVSIMKGKQHMSVVSRIGFGLSEILWVCFNPSVRNALDNPEVLNRLSQEAAKGSKGMPPWMIIHASLERHPSADTLVKRN